MILKRGEHFGHPVIHALLSASPPDYVTVKPIQLPLVFQVIKTPDRKNHKPPKLQGIPSPNRLFLTCR